MSAPIELGGVDTSRLATLILELAAQLHVERTKRLALEATLARLGIVGAAQIDATASDPAYRQQTAQLADESVRGLLRALSESPDERRPLRGGSYNFNKGES
ncbi:MAG TPA: hypothetical protein VFX20_16295 [Steroidobacteraceae bacterium]|nr:hypothetical protein [Steroidobacteraceae bacterium]